MNTTQDLKGPTSVPVADRGARRFRRVGPVPHPSRAERVARGKAARAEAPMEAHAVLATTELRSDPVELLERQAVSRVADLVPIRYGRMLVSPFAFYRGAALVMAADLASTANSGLRAQLCGDAHMSNFGVFASPERHLVFDANDFDETAPGPFEWDVKRLAASLEIAGRQNGFKTKERRAVVVAAGTGYRQAIRDFAGQANLAVWYAHLDLELEMANIAPLLKPARANGPRKRSPRRAPGTACRPSRSSPPWWTASQDRQRPSPGGARDRAVTRGGRLGSVRATAVPVVGLSAHLALRPQAPVGAVPAGGHGPQSRRGRQRRHPGVDPPHGGHRRRRPDVPPSQRSASVGARGVRGASVYANHGQRVVAGQHLMQAASDIFLGWQRTKGYDGVDRDYYVRQLRDWKGSAVVEEMLPSGMAIYGRLCGWTLARAHARSGDRVAIAAYLGGKDTFDQAIADFAAAYADQNDRDYAALQDAAASGRIAVTTGL